VLAVDVDVQVKPRMCQEHRRRIGKQLHPALFALGVHHFGHRVTVTGVERLPFRWSDRLLQRRAQFVCVAHRRVADRFELRAALKQSLLPAQSKLLMSRYRFAMVDFVNAGRKNYGLEPLDPSPVLLAHPKLDLFVDVDSKHSFEAVGCTSCHDGSGQETDFVVAAHVARNIWVDEKTGEPVLANQLKQPVEEAEEFNLSSMKKCGILVLGRNALGAQIHVLMYAAESFAVTWRRSVPTLRFCSDGMLSIW